MARRNIDHTHTTLTNRPETDEVYIDGDTTEAIFRALVDYDGVDDFEAAVDDMDVGIEKKKNVGFGVEVTLR